MGISFIGFYCYSYYDVMRLQHLFIYLPTSYVCLLPIANAYKLYLSNWKTLKKEMYAKGCLMSWKQFIDTFINPIAHQKKKEKLFLFFLFVFLSLYLYLFSTRMLKCMKIEQWESVIIYLWNIGFLRLFTQINCTSQLIASKSIK